MAGVKVMIFEKVLRQGYHKAHIGRCALDRNESFMCIHPCSDVHYGVKHVRMVSLELVISVMFEYVCIWVEFLRNHAVGWIHGRRMGQSMQECGWDLRRY